MMVFWLFLKNGCNDFGQNAPECRTNQYWTARENRMSKFSSVLEIFIHKVSILAKNGESGVQRSLSISRTVNAMENLIWYSESTKNYLSIVCHQIFPYSLSSGIWPEHGEFWVPFWMVFGHYLDHHSKYFDETWSEVRKTVKKQVQKTTGYHLQPLGRFDQNRPNFMNDPNFFDK